MRTLLKIMQAGSETTEARSRIAWLGQHLQLVITYPALPRSCPPTSLTSHSLATLRSLVRQP